MIHYALVCDNSHKFDGWFASASAYDTQKTRGLVTCPVCTSTSVDKAIMAPAVVGEKRAAPKPAAAALLDDKRREIRHALAEIRREIEARTDDVGTKFPEVARAIHAGDEPERAIRGRASLDEARALIEEGVGVMPIPALADEMN